MASKSREANHYPESPLRYPARMDPSDATRHLDALFSSLSEGERAELVGLRLLPDAPPHPAAPDLLRLHELRPTGGQGGVELRIFLGSAQALGLGPAELEAVLLEGVQEHVDNRAAREEIPNAQALFLAHAAWRSGQSPSAGWYRRGDVLGACTYAVDADIFLELALPLGHWKRRLGSELALELGGDSHLLEIPEDAALDEIWTLEGAGLFEPDLDLTVEELEEASEDEAEVEGTFGDLHVVPVVYDAGRWLSA